MHTGTRLGAAIETARLAKGISKKDLALHFGVSGPSVQGWVKTGRITKDRLMELIAFFSDTVDNSHWGLQPNEVAIGDDLGNGGPVVLRMAEASRSGLLNAAEWKVLDDLLSVLMQQRKR